jgi:hypothetical protein
LACCSQVESIRDRLLANNAQTYWVPAYVKEKRFHNWLEGAHDWAISRSRYSLYCLLSSSYCCCWQADYDVTFMQTPQLWLLPFYR